MDGRSNQKVQLDLLLGIRSIDLKILFISTALPPNFESQTIRNLYLIKGLQSAGHQVFGVKNITGHNDGSLENILSVPFETIVVKSGWYLNFMAWIVSLKIRFLERILNVLGPLVVVPDLNSGWSKVVIENDNVLSLARGCDLIITASGSYESHLAGLYLSKEYSLPLVCEMGDPWAFNPIWPETFWLKKIINKRLEARVIKHSTAVVFTTRETQQCYQRAYGGTKFHYVPMGFSRDDFNLTLKSAQRPSVINVVYVGVAYKGSRDITPLLDHIYKVNARSLRALFYGKVSDSFKEYVFDNKYKFVKFFGQVSYEDSIDVISDAHVLVILGNDSKLQIPGKTYMYLASGKPILYLANQDLSCDPTWNLIRGFDGVYGFDQSLTGLDEILVKIEDKYDDLLETSALRLKDPSLIKFDWKDAGCQFNLIVESAYAPTTL
jgi:hypothetical protein